MSIGQIVQVIGAVVDIEFPRDEMPKVYDALVLEQDKTNTLAEAGLTFEVQQQLGDGIVRTIAMGSSDGLRRGMKVKSTGAGISVPVGHKTLGRIMDVLGRPIDEAGPIGEDERRTIHRAAPKFDELLKRYVEALIYQAVAENMASEQSARMVAMKAASDNAKKLIGELQLVYNKTRQAGITKEITEIVGGAAAVS